MVACVILLVGLLCGSGRGVVKGLDQVIVSEPEVVKVARVLDDGNKAGGGTEYVGG